MADPSGNSPVAIGKDKVGFVHHAYRKGGRDIIAAVVYGVIKRLGGMDVFSDLRLCTDGRQQHNCVRSR